MKSVNLKKHKKPLIYKITLILQFGWLAILVVDMIIMLIFHTSVFTRESHGGDVIETVGLGFVITKIYPETSIYDPVQSSTRISATVLICGQLLLTVANIVQGIRFRNRNKKDLK